MTPEEKQRILRAKLIDITNNERDPHKLKMARKKLARIDPFAADFRHFLKLIWKTIGLPNPTPVQYDIAKYLQDGPKRSIVEAFRGVGKSFITGAFVAWHLYRDPQYKIMVVSAGADRATSFSHFVKRLFVEVPLLRHLQPDPSKGHRESVMAFDVGPATVDQSPSVKSIGITGQLTGTRADLIIADDIEVTNNSITQTMRDKLATLVKEFDAILKPLPKARIVYLGTPQTEMSLYNELATRGYDLRIWPSQYPSELQVIGYGVHLAPYIGSRVTKDNVGFTTDPQRFTDVDLAERLASYGKSGFALQFMLDTSLADIDRYPLKLSDIIVSTLQDPDKGPENLIYGKSVENMLESLESLGLAGDYWYAPMGPKRENIEWAPYTGCVMSVDPSGRGTDETAYAILKILAGRLYLVASGGFQGGYDEETVLKPLAELALHHQVKHIIVEQNFGGGMFAQLLKPVMGKIHPCLIEEVHHSTQKEVRIIDTLEPVLNNHRLVIDRDVIEADLKFAIAHEKNKAYSLFYQMTRITKDRGSLGHDDRLDALAIAVAYWVEHMSRDHDKAKVSRKDKVLKEELKKFVKHAVGRVTFQRNARNKKRKRR